MWHGLYFEYMLKRKPVTICSKIMIHAYMPNLAAKSYRVWELSINVC
jgi:hypothetical protein